MSSINRRALRRKLGSRTTRRVGTKTRVIPKSNGKKPPKYRTRRPSLKRPARLIKLMVRELLAKGGAR